MSAQTAAETADDDIDDSSAPLIEHLVELRNRILWSLLAFVVAMCLAFTVWNPIFNFLTHPVCKALADHGQGCGLVLIKLQEGFFVAISISLFGGLVLSFPVIAYQLWRFVAPGLYKSEKAAFLPFLIASPVMFAIGGAFCYYVVMPFAFDFFLGFQQGPLLPHAPGVAGSVTGAVPGAAGTAVGTTATAAPPANGEILQQAAGILFQGSVSEYLNLTMKFIIAFGLCFQMPILLTLLGKAGIVSAAGLSAFRRYAVVALLLIAAIATPGADITSMMILFFAVYPLYEVSILLVRRIEKKREARLRAEGLWDEDEDETPA